MCNIDNSKRWVAIIKRLFWCLGFIGLIALLIGCRAKKSISKEQYNNTMTETEKVNVSKSTADSAYREEVNQEREVTTENEYQVTTRYDTLGRVNEVVEVFKRVDVEREIVNDIVESEQSTAYIDTTRTREVQKEEQGKSETTEEKKPTTWKWYILILFLLIGGYIVYKRR